MDSSSRCDSVVAIESDRQCPRFPSEYRQATKKGEILLSYLQESEDDTRFKVLSKWTTEQDLHNWGWSSERQSVDFNHVHSSFEDNPLASESLVNGTAVTWRQDRDVEMEMAYHPATNAAYTNVFWPDKGIIFALDISSPEHAVSAGGASINPWKDSSGRPLPIVRLRDWSDVTFLTWQSITTPEQCKNVKLVLFRNTIDIITVKIISEIMTQRGIAGRQATSNRAEVRKAPVWPGFELRVDDEGFKAIVGSPNVRGLCWMMTQRQNEMGQKIIWSVRVFDDVVEDGSYAPSMLVELGDATEACGDT